MKRLLYFIVGAYFVLYSLPFPFDLVPPVASGYAAFWDAVVPFVGKHVFGLTITVQPNGSGDTTFNYVQVFCIAALAIAVGGALFVARRGRDNSRLQLWTRTYIRFVLAAAMLSYGAFKVIKSQFPDPSVGRLLQPFGDASPMGLLWTFMGASLAYNIFTGLTEILGGFLLTMRRTTLLGALISAGVMANVVMLNFSYDVPVKLYSSHLLAMAVVIAFPDAKRLLDFFVRNRPVEPAPMQTLFATPIGHRTTLAARTAFVAALTLVPLYFSYEQRQQFLQRGDAAIWNVTSFAGEGDAWQRVVFEPRSELSVFTGASRQRFRLERDAAKGTILLRRRENPDESYLFRYSEQATGMTLSGTYKGRETKVALAKAETPTFPLLTRGFHWVNEYPYNR